MGGQTTRAGTQVIWKLKNIQQLPDIRASFEYAAWPLSWDWACAAMFQCTQMCWLFEWVCPGAGACTRVLAVRVFADWQIYWFGLQQPSSASKRKIIIPTFLVALVFTFQWFAPWQMWVFHIKCDKYLCFLLQAVFPLSSNVTTEHISQWEKPQHVARGAGFDTEVLNTRSLGLPIVWKVCIDALLLQVVLSL